VGRVEEPAMPDIFGQFFRKDLDYAGAELSLLLKYAPTGICLYLKTAGGKTRIAASPSAALELNESDIPEEIIQRAGVIVIDGFMLDRTSLVRRILRIAEQNGKPVAIDLGSAAIARDKAQEIADCIKQNSLILFMNEDEAAAFYSRLKRPSPDAGTNSAGSDNDNADINSEAHSFFRSLSRGQFPIIAVKLGNRGAIVFAGGTSFRAETQAVVPMETTGAGDAFSAAFLSAWVQNKPLCECAELGNKAARVVLDVAGTRVNREQLKETASLL